MSVTVMGMVWKAGGLTSTQKIVLLAMADHASDDGRNIYPGDDRLAEKTSLAKRTIRSTKSDLQKMALLKMVSRPAPGRAIEYLIHLPRLKGMERTEAVDATVEKSPTEIESTPIYGQETAPTAAPDAATAESGAKTPAPDAATAAGESPQPSLTTNNHHESSKDIRKELTKAEIEETSHKTAAWLKIAMLGSKDLYSWPNAPEHLRMILVEFTRVWCDLYDRKLMDRHHKKFIKQAGQLHKMYGESVSDFIFEAGEEHEAARDKDGKPLRFNGPMSLEYAIEELASKPSPIEKAQPAERSSRVWTGS